MRRSTIHHYIYLICLIMIAMAIPLSNYVMSMGGIFLAVNWAAEWNWREKWERLKQQRCALIIASFFFIFLISLIKTDNWALGLDNVLSKLPILYMPIILASSKQLNKNELKVIINSFFLSSFIGTIGSIIYYVGHSIQDIREISIFISHIRFSLCLVLAILLLIYSVTNQQYCKNRFIKVLYGLLATWFIVYLFIAQTLTGIIMLILVAILYTVYLLFTPTIGSSKKIIIYSILSLILLIIAYTGVITYRYYHLDSTYNTLQQKLTSRGNQYEHEVSGVVENGRLIGLYVCKEELSLAWEERSELQYDSFIEATLIRYLNSKGFYKDYDGVQKLSNQDIANIELGIANVDYTNRFGLKRALYPTFFSISQYNHNGMIEHSSLLQRFELWKVSWKLIKEHPLFGVGVGDQKQCIDEQLAIDNSPLVYKKNMGCHNQYLSIWLMGGIIVFIYFIFVFIYPFIEQKRRINFLYIAFITIMVISFFMEDTIETQAGITLFTFFNSLFLFQLNNNKGEQQTI